MSFIKKTLASFGIGSAKVDSVLQQEVLYPGQSVKVTIHVYGGATEQAIDNIELKLCCRYIAEVASDRGQQQGQQIRRVPHTHTLASWSLPYAFTIEAGETRDFQIELEVPWNTPVTIGDAKVWLETGLDIAMALDPTDKDILTVRPDPLMDGYLMLLKHKVCVYVRWSVSKLKALLCPLFKSLNLCRQRGLSMVAGVKWKSWLTVIKSHYSFGLKWIVINVAHRACWLTCSVGES